MKVKSSLQMNLQTRRTRGWVRIYSPRYATTELPSQTEICYSIAMLNGGTLNTYIWNGLLAEAVNTAMLLENNLTPKRNLGPFQQFFVKRKRRIQSSMQTFGEMCIINYRDSTHWAHPTVSYLSRKELKHRYRFTRKKELSDAVINSKAVDASLVEEILKSYPAMFILLSKWLQL